MGIVQEDIYRTYNLQIMNVLSVIATIISIIFEYNLEDCMH